MWPLKYALAALLLFLPFSGQATVVRLQTVLGLVDIQLYDSQAPLTVANFLRYVNSGAYNNSFIHRSVPGFVIQGGGYVYDSAGLKSVTVAAPVANEFSATRSNLRGTIAMAKVGGNPDSATSQWFFNLADNNNPADPNSLDTQNGGFTVFGRVTGNGMAVVDAIAAQTIVNACGSSTNCVFTTLPVTSVPASGQIGQAELVMVTAATVLPDPTVTLTFVTGWNLVGNSVEAPITVANTFNDATKVNSVWKWNPGSAKWAFYTPGQADGGAAYAASKGYDTFATIDAGEGFWVQTYAAFSVSMPSGTAVQSSSFKPPVSNPVTAGGAHALRSGWSLIATGDNPTPAQLDAAIATSLSTPPAAGKVFTNLTTLWAWDATNKNWYFWAPSLVNSGGLSGYLGSKGYLDSATMPGTPVGSLSPTTGFWVNIP